MPTDTHFKNHLISIKKITHGFISLPLIHSPATKKLIFFKWFVQSNLQKMNIPFHINIKFPPVK